MRGNHQRRRAGGDNGLEAVARDTLRIFANAGEPYRAKIVADSTFHKSNTVPYIVRDGVSMTPIRKTLVSVERGDTLAVTRKYLAERPCVLNMASMHRPGGGWLRGCTAQEEQLCYRSGLFDSLALFSDKYPLADYDAIYSKDVPVIRDDDMTLLRQSSQYQVSFVSIAALCRPDLIHGCLRPDDAKCMAEKIRTMLRVAHLHNHSTLILGAFGCGAYGNPPRQTAGLFREVLAEGEFTGAFERIVFAIIDNSRTNNYNTFSEVLL